MQHFKSGKQIHVFIGPAANDYNTFAAFELEALEVGATKHAVNLKTAVRCHATAASDAGASTPDKTATGGTFAGTWQSGTLDDRSTLAALAAEKHRAKFFPPASSGGGGGGV